MMKRDLCDMAVVNLATNLWVLSEWLLASQGLCCIELVEIITLKLIAKWVRNRKQQN